MYEKNSLLFLLSCTEVFLFLHGLVFIFNYYSEQLQVQFSTELLLR